MARIIRNLKFQVVANLTHKVKFHVKSDRAENRHLRRDLLLSSNTVCRSGLVEPFRRPVLKRKNDLQIFIQTELVRQKSWFLRTVPATHG